MLKLSSVKLKNDAARVEFWVVTGCLLTALLISILDIVHQNQMNAEILMPLLFSYLVTFIVYLLLCFYLAPAFEAEDRTALRGSLFLFVFMALCYLVGIINIYFTALLGLKLLFIYFNRNRQNSESTLYDEAALLTASWLLTTVGLLYLSTPLMLRFYLLFVVSAAIVLYLYAVHILLPAIKLKNKKTFYYILRMFLFTMLSCIAVALISLSFKGNDRVLAKPTANAVLTIDMGDEGNIQILVILNFFTQLLLVTPLALSIYKRRNAKKQEEISMLKTELGQSDANLNFLKSQINPHFLFNALNTLYGTALQEQAARTGEGIQKLGDMMRFMLEENVKDKIPLSRDIDYLNSYILLQKLRSATSPSITIETDIEEYQGPLTITPMLLIPFVENAFKHGISLQNPSHIEVALQVEGDTLYFDVHNSVHSRPDNDPEKNRGGIGLENVKQRLNLLYPSRHELVIRENAREFFIHLTLQLAINN
jgi:two-component system LytT family sensor kinase